MGIRFDNTFKLSATALNLNLGHPSLTLNSKWAAKLFIFYIGYFPVFFSFIHSCFYDNFSKICTNLGLAVVFLIISYNYGLLIVFKKEFNDMIKDTEEDLKNSEKLDPEDQKVVEEFTSKGEFVSKLWFLVCVISGGVFLCKAIVGTLYFTFTGNFTLVPIQELTYPKIIEESKSELYMYIIILCFQSFFIFYNCLMYVGFNPLGLIFIMRACGQIELVIRKVDKLFSEDDIDGEETIKKLKDIVRHIQNIYSFVGQIQQTHKALYEMCLKTTTISLPVCCFGVIESYNQGSISIDLIGYVFACFMQCYIPCYYCEVLMSKGEDLQAAIYGCGWERHWVSKSRSIILLLLTRTARPLGIHAVFCTVSLEAFANLCNQSYSIFNVINAACN